MYFRYLKTRGFEMSLIVTQCCSPISVITARFKDQQRQKQEVYTFTDGVLDFEKLYKTKNNKPGTSYCYCEMSAY